MQKTLILVIIGFLTIHLVILPEPCLAAGGNRALLLAQADEEELGDEDADETAEASDEAPAPKPSGKKIGGKTVSQNDSLDLAESNASVAMTGLEFRPNQNGGSIIVRTSGPAQYSSRMNSDTNQFILDLPGTSVPKKFQRPFNTKEFAGAISIFTAFQSEGSRSSRIIVQLREPVQVSVQKEGNTLLIIPSGGNAKSVGRRERSDEAQEGELEGDPVAFVNGKESRGNSQAYSPDGEKKALSASLDEFVSGVMKYYGHPISVSFKEGDIRDVLNFIAEESGLNMVVSEEVKGNVNIKLRKIPWDQALIIILQAKQLGYVRQGNILRIAPLEVLKREAETTKQTLDSQKSLTPLRTKIFKLNFAAAKSLLANIKVFLTPNRGQALEDERSNSLIVTDIDETLNKVEELIRRLDRRTPQVLIEAKIIEARELSSDSFGINWQSLQNGVNIGNFPTGVTSIATVQATGGLSYASGTRLSELGDLNVVLDILEREDKVNILASPRILATNNKPATIRQSSNVSFRRTTAGTLGTPGGVEYQIQPVAEVDFTVTPQIANDGTVSLDINVSRAYAGTQPSADAPFPINTRSAVTTLLVRDGDTAVIGGIYQNETTQGETGVPILRQIPLIGRLFSQLRKQSIRSELLLFITPKILESDSDSNNKQAL